MLWRLMSIPTRAERYSFLLSCGGPSLPALPFTPPPPLTVSLLTGPRIRRRHSMATEGLATTSLGRARGVRPESRTRRRARLSARVGPALASPAFFLFALPLLAVFPPFFLLTLAGAALALPFDSPFSSSSSSARSTSSNFRSASGGRGPVNAADLSSSKISGSGSSSSSPNLAAIRARSVGSCSSASRRDGYEGPSHTSSDWMRSTSSDPSMPRAPAAASPSPSLSSTSPR
mmetsp:Transcript_61940/g.182987  ORF Transcript_61940/g.182987 Transcript_61940/m.182987 type:complete len:232 (-) Transcript_61940:1484-2179(-)